MADFLSHKLIDFHSINPGASLPFHVSPHLSFYTVRLSPPKRRSSSPISCNLSSHSNSPSSSLPPPIEIISTAECSDGSFIFKFGDPSEIVEFDENVNDSSDSDLDEVDSLDKAGPVYRTVNSAKPCSSDDVVLEPNAVAVETVHASELVVLQTDANERDFESVSVGVKEKETSTSVMETITDSHEGSDCDQIDDSITSPEIGIVVDIATNSPLEEEAPGGINDDADDSVYPEVSFEMELSNVGCAASDELTKIAENRLNADDHEVELMPKHARLEADLALEKEKGKDLPSDNLSAAESFVNSVEVDDGACNTMLADEKTDSDVEGNEISDSGLEIDQTDTVARGGEISSPTLALASGVASFTCPSQVLTGVEDAYLVAGEKWYIVANSVGQWSFKGMKPGLYAHDLIQNCQLLTLNSDGCKANVREVLRQSAATVQSPGLASVLIAHFDNEVLHVANIGDTGFIIIRNGFVHERSSPIIHEFYLPVQIGSSGDPLQFLEEHQVHLDDGDAIIIATDGLFDNLYVEDIASIVSTSLQDNMKPKELAKLLAARAHEELAELLAARAQEAGSSTSSRCPFADKAEAAGYTGVTGGKLDHVTVIVSLVKKQLSPQ